LWTAAPQPSTNLAALVVLLDSGVAIVTRDLVWAVVAFNGVTLLMRRRWLRDVAERK